MVNRVVPTAGLPAVLCSLGLIPYDEDGLSALIPTSECYQVLLNGKVMGRIPDCHASHFVAQLRQRKATNTNSVSLNSMSEYDYQWVGL